MEQAGQGPARSSSDLTRWFQLFCLAQDHHSLRVQLSELRDRVDPDNLVSICQVPVVIVTQQIGIDPVGQVFGFDIVLFQLVNGLSRSSLALIPPTRTE